MARPRTAEPTYRVGLSGWQYDSWRGDFYPPKLPARQQLAYVAEHFDTVELNASFYSLQRPSSYQKWYDDTPDDFVFAIKGGRYITHLKSLVDVETATANYFASGVLRLRHKLGPVLWQLPARMTLELAVMKDFLDLLPKTMEAAARLATSHNRPPDRVDVTAYTRQAIRHALEVRNKSYVEDDRFLSLLEEHNVSLVVSDAPSWPLLDESTSDFAYARLHGHSVLYTSGYSGKSLDRWADRCRQWAAEGREVFIYFDNDAHGRAPYDALGLAQRLGVERRSQ